MDRENGKFSKREKDVLNLLLQGKSNKQMALELGISVRTVEFHLSNIYEKLDVTSRTEAVLILTQHHLRDSTGDTFDNTTVESTVEPHEKSTENDAKINLRRIFMKNRYHIIGSSLLVIVVISIIMFAKTLSAESNDSSPIAPPPTEIVNQPSATQIQSTQTPTITVEPTITGVPTGVPVQTSVSDQAHFVSENLPDGSRIKKGETFTKTWVLQNTGTTTWTQNYSLVVTNYSHPLGKNLNEPYQINLPQSVAPGETVEISIELITPDTDGNYEVHYKLKNSDGQIISGDGSEVWLKIVVTDEQSDTTTGQSDDSIISLMNIQKSEGITNAEICAHLPDTQDWNINGVFLTAGNIHTSLSGYLLKNPKDPATYTSTYRCYIIEFPVGTINYGEAPISISISNIRVPAEHNLEANCVRAKQEIGMQYPDLDFTCGPMGFYYTNLVLPGGMDEAQADKIIMDALEQAIYGNWILSE